MINNGPINAVQQRKMTLLLKSNADKSFNGTIQIFTTGVFDILYQVIEETPGLGSIAFKKAGQYKLGLNNIICSNGDLSAHDLLFYVGVTNNYHLIDKISIPASTTNGLFNLNPVFGANKNDILFVNAHAQITMKQTNGVGLYTFVEIYKESD